MSKNLNQAKINLVKSGISRQIVVIGGGAAGMMAAISSAEQGALVTILEPNERLGKKLNITGKGRCNLTNDADLERLLENTPGNGRFLYSAFSRFDGRDAMQFFESLGVPLKVERGKRVFPVSDRAFDISAALERRLKKLHVKIIQDRAISLDINKIEKKIQGVKGKQNPNYPADAVILATGGVSYPATGSTGEGHRMASEIGHEITPLRGSLVPLRDFGLGRELQGLTLKNIGLTVFEENRKIYTDFGELLFTHFGVSGPLILSASAHMRQFGKKAYHLELDLKPALDERQLDRRLLSDFAKYSNQDFCNALHDLLPQKLIPVIISNSEIPPHTKVHEITREQRRGLLTCLKHFVIVIAGPCPVTEAIVTSGGVRTSEVNPKTMESKLVRDLYFAGEILDVDAYTGGFNLQIAWATGRAAGFAAAEI